MNPNPRTTLAALALGFGAGFLFARFGPWGPGPWHASPERRLERLSRELGLSPEQKSRVEALLRARREKLSALREELRPRFEAAREAAHEELRAVLTPRQQERLERLERRWRERRDRALKEGGWRP